jgi:hypothetical protein
MTDQLTDASAIIPYAPKENTTGSEADVDQAGNAILGLVDRAADTAVADLERREGSLRNLPISFELRTISFEPPRTG